MSLGIGDSFKLTKNPISRTTLALFAGASGDHNPIHIDLDFVIADGIVLRGRGGYSTYT